MSQRVYKASAGATIAVSLLLLTGCSASSVSEATADCPQGVTTLTVLRSEGGFPADPQLDAYKALEGSCVDFTVTEVPFGQYSDKLAVAISAKKTPDLISVDSPSTNSLASKGVLAALDEALPDGYKSDLDAADLAESSFDGKLYSLPLTQATTVLFYNKTLTDAAGITPPTSVDDAWTWSEFQTAALTCQQNAGDSIYGLAPSQLGAGGGANMYRDLPFLRSAGNPDGSDSEAATFAALASDGSTTDGYLNSSEAISAATLFQSLFVGDRAVSSATASPNAFVNGKACFDLTIPLFVGDTTALSFEAAVSPQPYISTPIVQSGALNIGVTERSSNRDVAIKAAAAMSSGTILADASAEMGMLPVLSSTLQAQPDLVTSPTSALIMSELAAWGQPRPVTTHYSEYDLYVSSALADIASGKDPKAALDDAVEKIDAILAD